jgi:hypothetical protein
MYAVEFAATDEADWTAVPLRFNVNVAALAAVLVTAIFVTTVVVADGTV